MSHPDTTDTATDRQTKLLQALSTLNGVQPVGQPNVFKSVSGLSIAGAEATIWTPTSGKKFRLMGYHLVSSVVGDILLKDGNSGSTIAVVPSAALGAGVPVKLGDGILSSAADKNLRAQGPALALLSGTVWGREE